MSLVKNLISPLKSSDPKKVAFIGDFFNDTERSDHPFKLAMHTYNQLTETTESREEIFLFMIEDVIFTSLYATFYEQLLFTAKENPAVAVKLINHFETDNEERERVIAEQTQHHLNFILNDGTCEGCPACDNHADVAELIPMIKQGDYQFFKNLYLGMQTIQFAMEELIYDKIELSPEWLESLNPENILEFRKLIIDFAENKNAC
jgi:hypothetical protein